jgi:uncharacterized protein YjbI with pentapeptide repeats
MVGHLNVTVVVKATLGLVHEGLAQLVVPRPVSVLEHTRDGVPGRSVELASDLAPHKSRADVTFVGHAYAPGGVPVPAVAVRMAIFRDKALLDKTLRVFGDRSAEEPAPRPFRSMRLAYERAYGGPSFAPNPVGVGADARVRGAAGAGSLLPNVVDPLDPSKPGGFGPISERWAERRVWLGGLDPAVLDAPILPVPDTQLFGFFQTAPADQQIDYLRGDEWIVLDNLHPTLPRLASRLPGIRGGCRLHSPLPGGGYGPGRVITLRLDTLAIDGNAAQCTVIFRGNFSVPEGEKALSSLRVVCGVELAGQAISWPEPRELGDWRGALAAPAALPAAPAHGRTAALSEDQQAWLAAQRTVPFSGDSSAPAAPIPPASPPAARASGGTAPLSDALQAELAALRSLPFGQTPPEVPVLVAPRAPVAPPPLAAPTGPSALAGPKERPLSRTVPIPEGYSAASASDAENRPPLPFVPASEAAPRVAPPVVQPAPRTGPLTGTAALTDDDLATLARVEPLPFVAPPPTERAPSAEKATRRLPPRTSPAVPIAVDRPLAVATLSFQVRPPGESLTVVVKGTFALRDGAPALSCDEPDPLRGDVYVDDDPDKALLYGSDLAFFKPRCDVTLVGHAHAPRGTATAVQVAFRLGSGPEALSRVANVLGDRTWKKALGVALAPSEPEPFDKLPLTWERAFGGPAHPANPVGQGHKSATLPDGTQRLPNIESAERPIRSPGDSPEPWAFGPVAPGWRARARFQGTYDRSWLATRWPYFPGDFDWLAAQHAPQEQRIAPPPADAPYELRGLSARAQTLRGSLPGLVARCFVEQRGPDGGDGGGFHELPLTLDTVHFESDQEKVILVWRGLLQVSAEGAPELAALFVTTEPLGGPLLSLEEARERMLDAALRGREGDEELRSPEPEVALPPAPEQASLRRRVMLALDAEEDLSDMDLSGANLSEVDFRGRPLRGALLLRAMLRGANLRGVDLTGAQLGGADLTGAALEGALLGAADFTGAVLDGARLDGASLSAATFEKASGRGASFRGVTGEGVTFVAGCWDGAVFDGAQLVAPDFSRASLSGASFAQARLPKVRLLDATGSEVRFDGATLAEARANGVTLTGSSFRSLAAPRSIWDGARLEGSSFLGAVLTGAGFKGVKAAGVDFGGVDAREGRFAQAELPGARFVAANLMKASFESANLEGADLRGANLYEAETWKARLDGALLDLAIVTRSKLATRG